MSNNFRRMLNKKQKISINRKILSETKKAFRLRYARETGFLNLQSFMKLLTEPGVHSSL